MRLNISDKVNNTISIKPPYVLTHTRGNSNPEKKNIAEHEGELFRALLDKGVTVVHLDWHNKPTFKAINFVNVCSEDFITVEKLTGLIHGASGMVGIDSGPTHLARTHYDLPTVQVWTEFCPAHFALPRPKLINLIDTDNPWKLWNKYKQEGFNIKEVEKLSGNVIADTLIPV